ncbi:hypothetical protein EP01_11310 [Bdellovibrio bacteriovorus]|uniref:hypothetical protein n=1 Tax=Bdellovibrio bacteriovorus TaxID=959 RepID=UPI00045BE64B|nr:hypothetical protein [Bdellovibrio bacteriovorus]AHZ85518.1 hypothetical protein EP01_11310 [Bdellovibrio bacteriovorus]
MKFIAARLLLLLFISSLSCISKATESLNCMQTCKKRTQHISDQQSRNDHFKLCYKLCLMEQRNPSVPRDSNYSDEDDPEALAVDPRDKAANPDNTPTVQNSGAENTATQQQCREDYDAEVFGTTADFIETDRYKQESTYYFQ